MTNMTMSNRNCIRPLPYSELRETLRRTLHEAIDLFLDADPGTVTPEEMMAYDAVIIEAIKKSRIRIPYHMPSDTIPCPAPCEDAS